VTASLLFVSAEFHNCMHVVFVKGTIVEEYNWFSQSPYLLKQECHVENKCLNECHIQKFEESLTTSLRADMARK
jgi:hypothetical protein